MLQQAHPVRRVLNLPAQITCSALLQHFSQITQAPRRQTALLRFGKQRGTSVVALLQSPAEVLLDRLQIAHPLLVTFRHTLAFAGQHVEQLVLHLSQILQQFCEADFTTGVQLRTIHDFRGWFQVWTA